MSPFMGLVVRALAFIYGFLSFCILSIRAFILGTVRGPPTAEFWPAVEKKRSQLWDLSSTLHAGSLTLRHAFYRIPHVSDGRFLHYLVSNVQPRSADRLVIFFHGWPDSGHLWLETAKFVAQHGHADNVLGTTAFIAPDLPGYGGSSSLARHDPGSVLGAMVEFIADMRRTWLRDEGHAGAVTIVAHDWGGVVAGRLAEEAPEVADRFIITQAPLTKQFWANVYARLGRSRALLRSFAFSPLNRRQDLAMAWSSIAPVIKQIGKSLYVFAFNLPMPLVGIMFALGSHGFLRFVGALAATGEPQPKAAEQGTWRFEAETSHLASSLGPSANVIKSVAPDIVGGNVPREYPEDLKNDVRRRSSRRGLWTAHRVESEGIRFYREGMVTADWRKSNATRNTLQWLSSVRGEPLDVRSKTKSSPFAPKDAPKVPVTMLWGVEDVAFEQDLMVDAEWIGGEANMVRMAGLNHWTPLQRGKEGEWGLGTRRIGEALVRALVE